MDIARLTRRNALGLIGAGAGMVATGVTTEGAYAQQAVADFYKGKTITLIVGSGTAGGDDIFARILAKYLPKYLPGNPNVVVEDIPAAGGLVAASQLATTQPRDGTVIGSVMRTIPMMPLLSDQKVNFDPRTLNWLGSLGAETNLIVVWHTSPDMSFDDCFKRETVVGTTGGSSDSNVYALLLNQTLGTKFKLVAGYPGGPDIDLAIERGEVEGRVSLTWSTLKGTHPDWLRDKTIRILAQMGLTRNPELPDVPNVLEYVKDPKVREVYEFLFSRQAAGRPFVAPPGIPADRLAALRKGIVDVAADKDFIADVEKTQATVDLMSGDDLQKMVQGYFAYPPDVIAAAKSALAPK